MINIGKQELNGCIVNINNLGRGPKDRKKLTDSENSFYS